MVQFFNLGHIILLTSTLVILGATILVFALWLRKYPLASKITIMAILFIGFVVHFLRLAFPPPGHRFPAAYQYISPMSISAFNAITFFFIFLFGNKMWKDYMFYMGFLTGLLAMLMPVTAYGRATGSFDAIRFFIIHGIIALAPILMIISGHHHTSWKRAFLAPFAILIVLAVILINEVMLTALGVIDQSMGQLLSHETRNGALVFGPEPRGGFATVVFDALTPKVFKTALFGIPSLGISPGDTLFWPVIWILVPGTIIFVPASLIMGIATDPKRFIRDMKIFWYWMTRQHEKRVKINPKKFSKLKTHS